MVARVTTALDEWSVAHWRLLRICCASARIWG
jgi:hypothetical protein